MRQDAGDDASERPQGPALIQARRLVARRGTRAFDLAWKYLWSSEALYFDLRTITIVSIDHLKCSKEGFRFSASHVSTDGLTIPKRTTWKETANWDDCSCTS